MLDRGIATSVITTLIDKLGTAQRYMLVHGQVMEEDRELYVGFGYRLRDKTPPRNKIGLVKRRIQDFVCGKDHFERLHLFAKAYILEPSAIEVQRVTINETENLPSDKVILVIDYFR